MKTRRIMYVPKQTGANTNYREISQEDMDWLQSELIRWISEVSDTAIKHDEDSKYIVEWWMKRHKLLPRSRVGQNSPFSFTGGMVKNLVFGTQRDLTDKQMEAIDYLSKAMATVYEDVCTNITFQIGFTK